MKFFYRNMKLNKSGLGLLVLALTIGGLSAKAANESNSSSESYLFCVKHNTNEVAYPATVNCPKGYTKLIVNKKGEDGATGPAGPAGLNGIDGTNGTSGIDGATGPAGPAGKDGIDGATGPVGPAGAPGLNGTNAPTTQYAAGYVLVSRGGSVPTPWASYSTSIGSPFGDTASGTFRFTCKATSCAVSLAAQSTAAGVTVWPRVMIYKSDILTGQIFGQCEYGDGVSDTPAFGSVGTTLTALTVNIGGSLDCGAGALQAYVAPGNVSSIVVPPGYYDVQTNFTFKG